jgi:hypothetical protein
MAKDPLLHALLDEVRKPEESAEELVNGGQVLLFAAHQLLQMLRQ